MCYSATASFTASAFLFCTGTYAVLKAHRYAPHYLLLALVPIFFALQQTFEGMVWLHMSAKHFILSYLFFAYFLWPGYIPLSLYALEKNPLKKKYLISLAFIGALVGACLYFPIVLQWVSLKTYPLAHSICYDLMLPDYSIYTLAILYLIVMVLASFISSDQRLRIFGISLSISYLMSYLFFHYAFTSVWCFFGAWLSLFIAYIIPKNKLIS